VDGCVRVGATDDDRLDRSRRIEWLDLDAIARARVLMVGAGALGNEVGKCLALSGFRHVTVVDMDHVVGSNLNRCLFFSTEDASARRPKAEVVAKGMRTLSPDMAVDPSVSRIEGVDDSIYKEHDVVLGCLDNIVARLHVNSRSYLAGRMYIDGGMEGLLGRVMVVRPPEGACIQCGMNRSHARVANLRFSCTGRDVVFHEPRLAAEITTTSIVSALMVREALKHVSGKDDMLLANTLYYDGQRNSSEEAEVPVNPDCPVHGRP